MFVAISNARLALLVKDIDTTWTNLVAIFAAVPGMVCPLQCYKYYCSFISARSFPVSQWAHWQH